jgi:hypothetical protein
VTVNEGIVTDIGVSAFVPNPENGKPALSPHPQLARGSGRHGDDALT